jgi:type IV pilus assembly protein PilW
MSQRRAIQGLTLIELMVSLAIGSLLIVGAVTVYSQSRSTYRVSDTVARLQENARYALSIMEPDIQLAGFYGFSSRPDLFSFISGGSAGASVPGSGLRATSAMAVDIGQIDTPCETNFAVNLISTVQGTNNTFGLACVPTLPYREGTDTLTIRRASTQRMAPLAGRVQLISSRFDPSAYIFADGQLPAGATETPGKIEVRDVVVRTYYIARDTETPSRPGVPALRVKSLGEGPQFADEEVISGVEDLQVQLGIERGFDRDGDGFIDAYTGSAVRYVDPDNVPDGYQVVSVRLWLLMRAEQPEQGFVDGNEINYPGNAEARNDNFRRVLVSRTIQLRNSRTM